MRKLQGWWWLAWNKSSLIGWKVVKLLETVCQLSSTLQSIQLEQTGLRVVIGRRDGEVTPW